MAVDDYLQMLARNAGQAPGALNVSPAVQGWLGRIQAAQSTPAPVVDGQFSAPGAAPAPAAPAPGPARAAAPPAQAPPAQAPALGPALHPVRNAILGLLAGGPAGMFQQIEANDQRKVALAKMQQVYGSLPDEYKPLFLADPQGFLTAYMKNIEPQKLAEGEMAVFGGPGGSRILNAKKMIDEKSGRPVYMTESGPVPFDSLGGDISAKDGLVLSSRTGVQGTYSSPQKLAMGETPGSFTPTVSGGAGGGQTMAPSIVPAAAAAGMARPAPARGQVADMIRSKAAAAGLDVPDQDAMVRIGQLESSLRVNPPKNGSSTGLFQMHPDTFARMGGKNIDDPQEQTDAAIRLYQNNKAALQAAGLPVTPTSLYLSHQQGLVAARALYEAHPDVPAVQAIAQVYVHQYGPQRGMQLARQAIVRNGGTANMTAGQFIGKWDAKVGGTQPPPANGPAVSAGDAGQPAAAGAGAASGPAPGWQVGSPAGMPGVGANVENLSGGDLLKALPPMVANQVKALAEGRVPAQGFALSKPYWQQIMQLAEQYEPGFDATVFQQRVQARKAVAPGGNVSNNLVALSTAQQHIGKLWKAIGDLHNVGAFRPLDMAGNATSEAFGQPNVTNFKAVRDAVTDELERALRGSGGSSGQIMEWRKRLEDSNSPDQLYGTAREMSGLLSARMSEALRPYNDAMGANIRPEDKMTPEAKDAFDMIQSGKDWPSWQAGKRSAGPSVSAPAAPKPGELRDGYRFNGGNPADPHSWSKAR